ncbi:MAG: cohesin domain-containing protein, partial [Thermoprotei archaeon]
MREGRKMKKAILLLTLILIATLFPTMVSIKTYAQNQTKLKVEPVKNIFYTNTTSVGQTFAISIIAENIIDQEGGMYGWEFWLTWTPGVINCTSEQINYGIWPYFSGPWITNPIDNNAGTYHQSLTARAPSNPVTGTYWLVNLTFQIVKAPPTGGTLQTELKLEPPPGMTYCLVDKFAGEIPHEYVHGVYKFISPRPPKPPISIKPNPPAIFDPTKGPCETFNLSILATDVAYLHGFILKVEYNKSILECQTVYEGSMLKSFGDTIMTYQVNNAAGYVLVSVNLTDPEGMAEGSGTLTIITFHVLDYGESVLHLSKITLLDPENNPLPYIATDGHFNNLLMPKLFIDPKEIIDPTMKPGS